MWSQLISTFGKSIFALLAIPKGCVVFLDQYMLMMINPQIAFFPLYWKMPWKMNVLVAILGWVVLRWMHPDLA